MDIDRPERLASLAAHPSAERIHRTRKPPGPKARPLIDRVADKVALDDNGCLIWLGAPNINGYGRICIGSLTDGTKKDVPAHRVVYELLTGSDIPEGLCLDHLCRNRICVNPEHLEPVTQRVNVLRGISPAGLAAAKTHCKHGHEFTPDNIYAIRGHRVCRQCAIAKSRRLRKRAALNEESA